MSENITLDWNQFRTRYPYNGYRLAFEELCNELFSRELKIKPGVLIEYHNQKGVEVEPIPVGSDVYSFQSKFSNDDSVLWSQFKTSAEKTIKEYPHLTKIINYTNGTAGRDNETRDAIEAIYAANNIKFEWKYNSQIISLLGDPSNADLKKKYFGAGQDLNMILPSVTTTVKSLSALKYQSEIVDFIGRESELSQLEDFIESSGLVKWWIIGGTGGSGKSRLALQLGKVYEVQGWHCGFVNSISNLNLDQWNPEKPHLIVCDYVLNKEEDIINLILQSIMLETRGELSCKIRILLIERNAYSVVSELKRTSTIGAKLESVLYDKNVLNLKNFEEDDLKKMLQELAIFFELPSNKFTDLYTFVKNNDPSRGFLLGGLFCLYHYNEHISESPVEFTALVRDLIKREKNNWLFKEGLDGAQEEYLVLATMIGGIELGNSESFSKDTIKFLQDVNPEVYSRYVGQESENYLAPLSHDLVSELYVLDSLKPINALNNKKFEQILSFALGINNGKELVSFFSRAANDYPKHPTLNSVLKEFSNEGSSFTIWLLIVTNIIDKINAPLEKKVDIYYTVFSTLIAQETFPKYQPILDAFYVRLLAHITNFKELDEWLSEYKIFEPKEKQIKLSKHEDDILVSKITMKMEGDLKLKPFEYCKAVVSAFFLLEEKYKKRMALLNLFELNQHFILHELSSTNANFDNINKSIKIFEEYVNRGLGVFYRDIMVGFVQWGHVSKQSDAVVKSTMSMLEELEEREPSVSLASCYAVASRIVSETIRTFDARKNIIDRFETSFKDVIEKNEELAKYFIGACVALMSSPLNSDTEYLYLRDLIQKSQQLLNKYPTLENAENFSLAIVQLTRYRGEYSSDKDKLEILNESINIAKIYGQSSHNIVQNVVSEISILYNKSNQIEQDSILLAKAIDLITDFKDTYISETKVQMGGFYSEKFKQLLEIQDYEAIKKLIDSMVYMLTIDFVEIHSSVCISIESELFKIANTAIRENNIPTLVFLKKVVEYYFGNLLNKMNRDTLKYILDNIDINLKEVTDENG